MMNKYPMRHDGRPGTGTRHRARRFVAGAAAVAAASGLLLATAPAAMAGTAVSAAPGAARTATACGYREQYPFAYWYNCRTTNVKIRVDVILYPDYDYCTLPGDNLLDSGSSRTRGAREIGGC